MRSGFVAIFFAIAVCKTSTKSCFCVQIETIYYRLTIYSWEVQTNFVAQGKLNLGNVFIAQMVMVIYFNVMDNNVMQQQKSKDEEISILKKILSSFQCYLVGNKRQFRTFSIAKEVSIYSD